MLVFGLWRIPRLQTMLLRNFCANPVGCKCFIIFRPNILCFCRLCPLFFINKINQLIIYLILFMKNKSCKISAAPCRSMLLSTFSHYSFFHIFANMYVLNSFSNGVMALGKEQMLALYLSAGCVASFASYAHKVFAGVAGASLGAVNSILV